MGGCDANCNNGVEQDESDNRMFNVFDGTGDGSRDENEWRKAGEGYDWGF